MDVFVYFDGGVRSNPSHEAACGVHIVYATAAGAHTRAEYGFYLGPAPNAFDLAAAAPATAPNGVIALRAEHGWTNNEAEYAGALAAVDWITAHAAELAGAGVRRVTVRGDSALVVNQLAGRWQVAAPNLRGWHRDVARASEAARARLVDLCGAELAFEHVRRAANTGADRMANRALDAAANVGVDYARALRP